MNHTRKITNKTSVHKLIKFVVMISFVLSAPALTSAEETKTSTTQQPALPFFAPRDNCEIEKERAVQAREDIEKACGDAGLGNGKECYEKAFACKNVSTKAVTDNASDLANQVLSSLGLNSAVNIDKKNPPEDGAGCPQFSGQDYHSRKKEVEREIKDLNKELDDLKKELAKQQKDTQKEMADLTKEVQESKKSISEAKVKLDEDLREKVAAFTQTQADTNNRLRQSSKTILEIKSKIVATQREQSIALLEKNAEQTKTACVLEAEKQRQSFIDESSKKSISTSVRKQRRKMILNAYHTCLKRWDEERQKLVEQFRSGLTQLTSSLDQAQAEMQDIETSLKQAQTQLNEMKTQSDQQKTALDKELIEKMQTTQTQMQAAQTNFQQLAQETAKKQQEINAQVNEKQNELVALGPNPGSDTSISGKKAQGIINAKLAVISAYTQGQCCQNNTKPDPFCESADKEHGEINKLRESGSR